jgi:hypothetical protein
MEEDREVTVACEACGEKELILTEENAKLFKELDLFVCDRCVYSWNMISAHLRELQMKAKTREDHEDFDKYISKLLETARAMMLKKKPLPRLSERVEPQDRLDSIILNEDSDEIS